MKDSDITFLNKFIHDASGVALTKEKVYLLEARLQPVLDKHKIPTMPDLVKILQSNADENLKKEVVDALMTHETLFFRDTTPFEQFSEVILPYLLKTRQNEKKIRIWSSGCSSGQEPYSIAIQLADREPLLAGWNIEILATDISSAIVEKAKEGIYSQFEVQRGLPIQNLVKYFVKDEQKWKVKDSLKSRIKFDTFNLLNDPILLGKFDVIFCRNVLIYFELETKQTILQRFSKVLKPDGFLTLGGSESVIGVSDEFTTYPKTKGMYVKIGHEELQKAKA